VATRAESTIEHNGGTRSGETRPEQAVETSVGRTTFSDVARAHYHWDVEEGKPGASPEQARGEFDRTLARFEQDLLEQDEQDHRARIVEAYWCRKRASGVALVEVRETNVARFRPALRRLRLWWPVPEYRVYRETDWVTDDFPPLAHLLHTCDVLEMKARWSLESNHAAVVMSWLMAVEARILGFIDSQWRVRTAKEPSPGLLVAPERVERVTLAADLRRKQLEAAQTGTVSEVDAFHGEILAELTRIEDYYHQAGMNRARLHYATAMLILGVPLVAIPALASAVLLALLKLVDLDDLQVRQFYACIAAGAAGAIFSVLLRMARKGERFVLDHELGAHGVRVLGLLRPLVGAVSGIVVSLLVQTSFVPVDQDDLTINFIVVVAFLAGFSERWTKVVLDGAMRTISDQDSAGGTGPPATADTTRTTTTTATTTT